MDLDEAIKHLSFIKDNTKVSGKEAGQGIIAFGKILKQFNQLSPEEKKQFLIDGFRKMYNEDKSACEEFARRHPDSWLNKHIPK